MPNIYGQNTLPGYPMSQMQNRPSPWQPSGSFASYYQPQMQRMQQYAPNAYENLRQQFAQMRNQQGPGFWKKWVNPAQGLQANAPGFFNMYQGLTGQQMPNRYYNYAQRQGWLPQNTVPGAPSSAIPSRPPQKTYPQPTGMNTLPGFPMPNPRFTR